jgi:hypothetical protein
MSRMRELGLMSPPKKKKKKKRIWKKHPKLKSDLDLINLNSYNHFHTEKNDELQCTSKTWWKSCWNVLEELRS